MPLLIRNLKTSGKCSICFVSLLRLCHNDCIYQTARNNGIPWSGWCINQSVYLHNYFSPVCLYCLTNRKRISWHEHIIKCNIAFSVCRSSFDQRNGNLWKFIIQKFIPIHFNMFYQWVINRNSVNSRSFSSWIYKNIQTNFGKSSGKPPCLCTDCVGNTSKRQIICFKPILQHQFFRAKHCSKMTTDQLVHCTFFDISFCIMFLVPDTNPCTRYNCQMRRWLHLLISSVDCLMKFRRILYSYKWIDTDTVTVPNQTNRFICTHNFIHNFISFVLGIFNQADIHTPHSVKYYFTWLL